MEKTAFYGYTLCSVSKLGNDTLAITLKKQSMHLLTTEHLLKHIPLGTWKVRKKQLSNACIYLAQIYILSIMTFE